MASSGTFRASIAMLALAGLVSACAPMPDPRQDADSLAVFDAARRHDFAAIEARLPPPLRTAVTDARLQAQAAVIPDQPPLLVKLAGFQSAKVGPGRRTSTSREYFYSDRLLVVTTVIGEAPGQPPQVLGFNIQPFARTALAVGRFDLTGKSSIQYFLLGLAVAIPLLLVLALALLARDRMTRWKWAWTLLILIGFMRLSVNWTTGALLFQPLALLLLGAAVERGPLDVSPWIVSISLPVGALIYLGRAWFAARPQDLD
jgi:hypothetical protein